jgi:hypothetical protein
MARYLLVLDDLDDGSDDLVEAACTVRGSDPSAEFVLLVPATPLAALDALVMPYTSPTQRARKRAQSQRASLIARDVRVVATRLGNRDVGVAVEDALRFGEFEAVIVAGRRRSLLHRLRRDVACRLALRFPRQRVLHAALCRPGAQV